MKNAKHICAVALILAVSLFAAAALAAPPIIDPYEYPAIDGSTATIPLARALRVAILGEDPDRVNVVHLTTPEAYYALAYGDVDFILATPPSRQDLPYFDSAALSQAEFDKYNDYDTYVTDALGTLEMIPVAKDALVFLNNAANPVTDLTIEQLKNIYIGNTTSWRAIGGEDRPIIPYQRNNRSGSQTLFLSLLMENEKPMAAPEDWVPYTMGQLVEIVDNYQNGPSALGFSVYYYVSSMYALENIRILAVNGVLPTEQTIMDDSYPLSTYYYAVLPKDTPDDDPARQIVNWLLTDEGQALVKETGYIPLKEE